LATAPLVLVPAVMEQLLAPQSLAVPGWLLQQSQLEPWATLPLQLLLLLLVVQPLDYLLLVLLLQKIVLAAPVLLHR
jgi:hypothetical protein